MLNRALSVEAEAVSVEPMAREAPRRRDDQGCTDLARLGVALVKLEAWARQQGFAEIAGLIDVAADMVDEHLTGARPHADESRSPSD